MKTKSDIAEQNARFRRKHPHPLHQSLAKHMMDLDIKFECEKKIAGYYADFCFPLAGLVVELDGSHHDPARDQKRDEHLRAVHYHALHFPTTMQTAEIAAEILAWIGAWGANCHACRNVPKTGKRYCRTCSQNLQESYRTKQLGLPQNQFLLWPECRACSDSGWLKVDGSAVMRCKCRGKEPLRFPTEEARDKALQERRTKPLPPEEIAAIQAMRPDLEKAFKAFCESKRMPDRTPPQTRREQLTAQAASIQPALDMPSSVKKLADLRDQGVALVTKGLHVADQPRRA